MCIHEKIFFIILCSITIKAERTCNARLQASFDKENFFMYTHTNQITL